MGKLHDVFPMKHFQAILFRRLTLVKRSLKSIIVSIVGTLIFSLLAIVLQWLMIVLMNPKHRIPNFDIYYNSPTDLVFVGDKTNPFVNDVQEKLKMLFEEDTGIEPKETNYESSQAFNDHLYKNLTEGHFEFSAPFVIDYQKTDSPYQLLVLYNSTSVYSSEEEQIYYGVANINRALWKMQFGNDKSFTFKFSKLQRRLIQRIFGQLGPMLIACGLISIVPLIISQPITDINGEVRQYMVSCTLKILPYWAATFLIDIVIWIILTTVIWAIFNAAMITSFHDNLFSSWYTLTFAGPSFLLFIYCFSFLFSSPDSAPRQAFMLLILILIIPTIVVIIRNENNPEWLDWIYSLFPHISIQQLLGVILTFMGSQKHSFSFYWTYSSSRSYLIMQLVDIVIYSIILTLIEMFRLSVQRKNAKKSFGDYHDFFKEAKSKHPVTPEAHQMEDEVRQSNDYAVRIFEVSRLFINTAGEPIPAVNCVSLGVKEGSLFGFLGANGAGKTTLIRMITGMLPPSDGTIEIMGSKIEDLEDPTILSICPQFNSHLCMELTPREHFKLYTLLFQMDPKKTKESTENLIKILELEELGDKPIRELSGGDVRKLAIALSFLGPAKIILLDEPTASLDPVARHHVHDMILEYKGQKTFMLCTHLLSEAENLCDMISIMIKGTVYTVGSPEYLTQKFGTEYKVDVMLDDDKEDDERKCDNFFREKLPTAVLSIKRPKARIYSIPASDIKLPALFKLMQKGSESDFGFTYYTCSCSSLESVFMEIVRMSEGDGDVMFNMGNNNVDEDKKDSNGNDDGISTRNVNNNNNRSPRAKTSTSANDAEIGEISGSDSVESIYNDSNSI